MMRCRAVASYPEFNYKYLTISDFKPILVHMCRGANLRHEDLVPGSFVRDITCGGDRLISFSEDAPGMGCREIPPMHHAGGIESANGSNSRVGGSPRHPSGTSGTISIRCVSFPFPGCLRLFYADERGSQGLTATCIIHDIDCRDTTPVFLLERSPLRFCSLNDASLSR